MECEGRSRPWNSTRQGGRAGLGHGSECANVPRTDPPLACHHNHEVSPGSPASHQDTSVSGVCVCVHMHDVSHTCAFLHMQVGVRR